MRLPGSPRKPVQVEGAATAETRIERSVSDPQALHRAAALWTLCAAISLLVTTLLLRDWFFVAWSLALLAIGSWTCSVYWRMGDTTQHITIERWVDSRG